MNEINIQVLNVFIIIVSKLMFFMLKLLKSHPFRWYQANLVSSNLPSCPSVRLLRGVCHLDIPKEIGEERSLDDWLADEILPGERYLGK